MTRKKQNNQYDVRVSPKGEICLIHNQKFDLIREQKTTNWEVMYGVTKEGEFVSRSNQIWNTDFVYQLELNDVGIEEANKDLKSFAEGVTPHLRVHLNNQKKMVLETHQKVNQAQLIYLHYVVGNDEDGNLIPRKQNYIATMENIVDGESRPLGKGEIGRWLDFRINIYDDNGFILFTESLKRQLEEDGVNWLKGKIEEVLDEGEYAEDWIWSDGYDLSK
tara:strand:+ start:550 stop:1209 length:660 start_codon:yes stop_codon:yes gene_type:complete